MANAFVESVVLHCEGHGLAVGKSAICPICTEDIDTEGLTVDAIQDILDTDHCDTWFAKSACDSCGSRFGGDRDAAHYVTTGGDVIHYDICVDCIMFHANGDEPDSWTKSPRSNWEA